MAHESCKSQIAVLEMNGHSVPQRWTSNVRCSSLRACWTSMREGSNTARRQCSAWNVELSAVRRAKILASRESGCRVAHSRQVVRCHPMETLEHLDADCCMFMIITFELSFIESVCKDLYFVLVLLLVLLHCESKRLDPSFEHNFRKYCPIIIILSLLQTEIIWPQTCNWIYHFTYSLLLHYLEKCNHIHFFTETASAMHAVISLLLQSIGGSKGGQSGHAPPMCSVNGTCPPAAVTDFTWAN